jgi:hypothetical protein
MYIYFSFLKCIFYKNNKYMQLSHEQVVYQHSSSSVATISEVTSTF